MKFYKIKPEYIFLLLMFFGCAENKEFIEVFFEKLEARPVVSGEMANTIKSLPQDSLYRPWSIFLIEHLSLIKELECEDKLHQYIDSNAMANSSRRSRILFSGFQKYLNHMPIDMDEIRFKIVERDYKSLPRRGSNSEIHKKELAEIIAYEDSKWKVGDTLEFIFPISNERIYLMDYPASLDFPRAKDTLKVSGLLVAKYYNNNYLGIRTTKLLDPFNLFFRLKIIEMNQKSIRYFHREFQIGDDFHLPLQAYGRPIG